MNAVPTLQKGAAKKSRNLLLTEMTIGLLPVGIRVDRDSGIRRFEHGKHFPAANKNVIRQDDTKHTRQPFDLGGGIDITAGKCYRFTRMIVYEDHLPDAMAMQYAGNEIRR